MIPMSDKRKQQYLAWRKELQKTGWDTVKTDSVQFNSGSETILHVLAKTAAAYVLKQNRYRVDSEVEHPERGEIDIIGISCDPDESPIAVELERSPTQEVKEDKLSRYHDGTPFREVFIINLNDAPLDGIELTGFIADELGMNV